MKKSFIVSFLLLCSLHAKSECSGALNTSIKILDSDLSQNLCQYFGKVVLVVNVASRCGYTSQYSGLQALYAKHKSEGLVILGVPSRDFFQEYSDESKVAEFCSTEYGVTFPMFSTVKVRGRKAHPLYKKLIAESGNEPRWNFNKYLINRDGKVIEYFKSNIKPESNELIEAIKAAL